MRRRAFIRVVAGAAAWPLAGRAQQPAMPVVGFLNGASPDGYALNVTAFLQGLKEAGYIEGRDVTIEYRWAEGRYNQLPGMADDLVRRQVAVIAANTPAAPAAKAATKTIPIVVATSVDPVAMGLVASLNQPGGNVTGVATLGVELGQKELELLHEVVPKATVMALLVNPTNPTVAEAQSSNLQAAARILGLELHVLQASTERDFETVFATLDKLRVNGLVIGSADPFFIGRSEQLARLALRHGLPAIFQYREFAAAGGLMSYGASITDLYRQAGIYAGRILKGEKPADLPVMQSTKFDFLINLKTAKALGLTVPLVMQMTADEVIE